ncbi:unnamed protein product [Agarophyton chilense]|eukprot:gb/GEZJ01003967.1/.p1 GENE.gb/GEZJ01003967.1/~~gb/GEZJ01003967.1/.p1  ORF type:complete len:392 (+),score=30.39 gb/GEZJ01003967.1/:974-2149(+)
MSARVALPSRRRRASPSVLTAATRVQRFKPSDHKPVALCWSPLGTFLAVAVQQGPILLFYVLPNKQCALRTTPIRTYTGHSADVLHMCFSNSNFLLSASMDRCVRLWHTDTALCLRRFVHPDMVTAVSFHPVNENYVISGGCDGIARIWRPADHACISQTNLGSVITVTQFCEQGKRAYVACYDGTVSLLNVDDATHALPASSAPQDLQRSVADVNRIKAGTDDSLCNAPSLRVQRTLNLKPSRRKRRSGCKVIALRTNSHNGNMLALCADGRVHVVDSEGRSIARYRTPFNKEGVGIGGSLSCNARWMIADALFDVVRLVDVHAVETGTGLKVDRIDSMAGCDISCAAFATNGAMKHGGFEHGDSAIVMAVGAEDSYLTIVQSAYSSSTP